MDMPVKALNTEKAKALQAALAQIEKQYGKGTIMRLGEGEVIDDIEVVSTGSLGLDIALGTGGLPRGRIVEVYGPESSGKTTLALHVLAEAQRAELVQAGGGRVAGLSASFGSHFHRIRHRDPLCHRCRLAWFSRKER